MAKRRGSNFGGAGMGANPNAMLKQLQKMQEDMVKAQEALAEELLEVQAAGGAITVVISGHQRVKSITIKPELLDTSDPEWVSDLQDLLVVAVNQAIEQSQQRAAERMEAVSGGMGGMLSGGLSGLLGG
ncbi:MAG: YbaB/EbfC family nucleoid-associated protein [Aggregatilineales bacterium]